MANRFEQLAKNAANQTKTEFQIKASSLTKLTDVDIADIIEKSGISEHEDLANIIAIVKNATVYNEHTAKSITSITNGVNALLVIAKKFI